MQRSPTAGEPEEGHAVKVRPDRTGLPLISGATTCQLRMPRHVISPDPARLSAIIRDGAAPSGRVTVTHGCPRHFGHPRRGRRTGREGS